MSVREFRIVKISRKSIVDFIEANHYSGSVNGVIGDYCFGLYTPDNLMIGGAMFGRLAMHNQWKKFGEKVEDVVELRRLCCINDTPRNTESFFIGQMLKWMGKNTDFKTVVSYADAQYGHTGVIYKASNFEYLGLSKGAKVIDYAGKLYHDKAVRTKYKGVLKPFAQKLVLALEDGSAKYMQTAGKHTYVYKLRK